KALAARGGARHAVAFANGTAALPAAGWAAGLGASDEAITTPLTFAATANAVVYQGGGPVFADIDARTVDMVPGAAGRAPQPAAAHGATKSTCRATITGSPTSRRRSG